jgi:hypothetical protein
VDEGQRAGNLLVLIPCTWFLALLRCYRGDFAAAAELTRRLLTPAESDGPPHAAIAGWAYQAIVSALAGHPEDAGRIAHAIRDSLSPRPPDARAIAAFLSLAEIALLLRDAALAAAVYPQLRDVHNSGVLFPVGWPCLLPRVLGGLATLQGRFDEADRHLAVAAHIATALNARPELALSHVELARLYLGRPDSGPPTVALHHAGAAETIVRDLGMAGLEPYTRAVRAQAERAAGAPASLVSPGSARQNQTAS